MSLTLKMGCLMTWSIECGTSKVLKLLILCPKKPCGFHPGSWNSWSMKAAANHQVRSSTILGPPYYEAQASPVKGLCGEKRERLHQTSYDPAIQSRYQIGDWKAFWWLQSQPPPDWDLEQELPGMDQSTHTTMRHKLFLGHCVLEWFVFAKFDNWYREEGPGLGFCFCFEMLSLRYPHVVEVETSCRQMDT